MARPLVFTRPFAHALGALTRRPALAAAAVCAGFAAALIGAAPVLFVSSVGAGVVQAQYDRACPATVSPGVSLDPAGPVSEPPEAQRWIREAAAGIAVFGEPVTIEYDNQSSRMEANGGSTPIGFLAVAGFRDHIEVLAEQPVGDIWLPDASAAELGVGVGDSVDITSRATGTDVFIIRGIFRDLAARPLDDFWCGAAPFIDSTNLFTDIVPPPMALVEPGSRPLRAWHGLPFRQVPRTADEARIASDASTLFADRLAALVDEDVKVSVVAGIGRIADRAPVVRASIRDTITPIAALTMTATLGLVAVLGAVWVRTRRTTCVALITMGIAPRLIGVKAAIELAAWLALGGAGGFAFGRTTMWAWAPTTRMEPGGLALAGGAAIAALVLAAALAGTVAARTSRQVLGRSVHAPRIPRWLRFTPDLALGLAPAWAWRQFPRRIAVPAQGTIVDTSSAALLFPLTALAFGACVLARLWLLATRRHGPPPGPAATAVTIPRRLALRRLQHTSRVSAALAAFGAIAFGVASYGAGMSVSLQSTSEAKTGVFAGADVVFLTRQPLPDGTPGATQVWQRDQLLLDGVKVDVLAVDPAAFAAVAYWDASFADQPLPELLANLSVDSAGALPRASVIAIGDVPDTALLTNPRVAGNGITIEVAARARSFPGVPGLRPALVLNVAAAEASGIKFQRFIWAKGEYEIWRDTIQRLELDPIYGISGANRLDSSVLRYAAWSFEFARALGIFVAGLVAIAVIGYLAARQRGQAVAFAFLRRMGVSARRHWLALVVELAAIVTAALALGLVLGISLVRVVGTRIDPLPSVRVATLFRLPWATCIGLSGAAVALVIAGSWLAQVIGQRADVVRALRDGA